MGSHNEFTTYGRSAAKSSARSRNEFTTYERSAAKSSARSHNEFTVKVWRWQPAPLWTASECTTAATPRSACSTTTTAKAAIFNYSNTSAGQSDELPVGPHVSYSLPWRPFQCPDLLSGARNS